jgi:hypothetical protein
MIESIFFNPWIWIIPIIIGVSIPLTIFGIRLLRLDDLSVGGILSIGFGGMAFVFLSAVYFGWMLPPYDASYYQTYRITGELTEVQSAFSGDEGTMSQVFISRVDGVDLLIKSDDQRFRTLEVGDDVNLVCGKGFAYFQEPWYDCSFGGAQ